MAGMTEPEMTLPDTTATDSSGHSMHDVQPLSPIPTTSTAPINSEHASSQPRPGTCSGTEGILKFGGNIGRHFQVH